MEYEGMSSIWLGLPGSQILFTIYLPKLNVHVEYKYVFKVCDVAFIFAMKYKYISNEKYAKTILYSIIV